MKVKLAECYRSRYTLEDLDRAKRVIAIEREDSETPIGYATYAVNEALRGTSDCLDYVISATAETERNCRVWDAYEEGSADMDVWIDALAKTWNGFIKVGAYLSDILKTGSESYKDHLYVKYYKSAPLE